MPKQTYSKGAEEAKLPEKISGAMMGKMKPMLHLDSKDVPEIKDWEVGKTYEIELTVKQVSKRSMDDGMCCEFEIIKAETD